MSSKFKTIANPSEGIFKDKGSKFIGFAFPISTEEEFKSYHKKIKEEHPDSGHFCYAFCLGVNQEMYRYSDDGEPSGTAGKPIYGQILSNELTNICIIVIRYFGGTKLGVSGLINAYRSAAAEALNNSTIIERELSCSIKLSYNYDNTSLVERAIKELEGEFIEQKFTEKCTAIISLPLRNKKQFLEQLKSFSPKPI